MTGSERIASAVRIVEWTDGEAWDAFVATAPDSNVMHRWAWRDVIEVAPGSPEAQAAKRALDSLQSAHPTAMGGSQKPGA